MYAGNAIFVLHAVTQPHVHNTCISENDQFSLYAAYLQSAHNRSHALPHHPYIRMVFHFSRFVVDVCRPSFPQKALFVCTSMR